MRSYYKSLYDIANEMSILGSEIYDNLKGDMRDDLQYMCMSFAKRQLSQLRSLIRLEDSDDIILIARSMFEGGVYLSYSFKNKEMCRRWRLYCCVVDIQRMENDETSVDSMPEEVRSLLESLRPEVDSFFKKPNGAYDKYWYGNTSIKNIAQSVDNNLLYFYNKYYSPMSEYHHWATAAFGKRYKIDGNEITETNSEEVEFERSGAMCMALSSVLSTMKFAATILGNNQSSLEKITHLSDKLKNIDGTFTREIKITRK
ncbi:hypothetical protein D3C80_850880 [compost metagenome]